MTEELATLETEPPVHRFHFAALGEVKPAPSALEKRPEAKEPVKLPAGLAAILPPTPQRHITEKELEAAKAEAYAKGLQLGAASAKANYDQAEIAREEAVRKLMELLANRIMLAAEMHNRTLKEREDTMGKLAIAVAKKLSGEALKRDPYSTVETLLSECIALIIGEPKITISVSPARVEGLRQRIDTLKPLLAGFEGKIVVDENKDLKDQDCRVAWADGYGEHNAAKIWNDVEALIAQKNINP